MSYSHIITKTVSSNGQTPVTQTYTLTTDNIAEESIAVAQGSSPVKREFSFGVTHIKMVYILCTGLVAGETVTLNTYAELSASQGSALDTITLTTGIPLVWETGLGTNPLQVTTGVNSIKVTNSNTGETATVQIIIGYNGS